MDFPLEIDKVINPIVGMDELKQTILLLLKNHCFEFLQGVTTGAKFDVHSPEDTLRIGINETLKEIPGLSVQSMDVDEQYNVMLIVEYNGDVEQFQFNLDNENEI